MENASAGCAEEQMETESPAAQPEQPEDLPEDHVPEQAQAMEIEKENASSGCGEEKIETESPPSHSEKPETLPEDHFPWKKVERMRCTRALLLERLLQ